MTWNLKIKKLEGYKKAKEKGEVDEDIIPLLDFINSLDFFVTLSSCSGRIAVVDLPNFGNKIECKFLGKWHKPVKLKDVLDSATKCKNLAWLIQYPPIIHIACKDLESAKKLIAIANNSGFKRSGIISLKNLVVEVSSLERIELPIAKNGKLLVDEDYLSLVIDLANEKLRRGKEKLKRFELMLRSEF